MTDVVVTLPKSFGLEKWIEEGDAAGDEWTGQRYEFSVPGRPNIERGERVYVVYNRHLIGFSPLVDYRKRYRRTFLIRAGEAVAVTIDEEIPGFRGYRYVWWSREEERPFPEWRELANR